MIELTSASTNNPILINVNHIGHVYVNDKGMPKDVVKWRKDVEEWIASTEGAHAFLQICERQGMEYPFNARGLFQKIYKEIKK